MIFKRFLAGLAALLSLTPASAQEVRPDLDPAVWQVKDADTTIYLFGTVHALDGKGEWFNDEVKGSFDRASELVLEIVTPEDQAAVAPLMQKYAIDTSGPALPTKLQPKYQKMLADRLTKLGLPANAFDRFRPFFAAMTISVLDMTAAGISPDSGAEKVLTKAAKDRNMAIGEVETIDQQFAMMNALPEKEQVLLLEKSLEDSDETVSTLNKLIAAWGKGDAATVASILNETNTESPALYKLLLTDRNRAWAEWIDRRLDRPGTVFMAVGAGHLAGPDSVQRFLKERGIEATRVPAR